MPETGVTLRFTMEGYEEIQDQLEEIEQTEDVVIQKAEIVERKVMASMSKVMLVLNTGVSLTLSMTKLLGIYIDKQHEFLVRSSTAFFNQLIFAAGAYATNPAMFGLAVATSTAAFALELQAQKLQQEQQQEASRALADMSAIGEQLALLIRQTKGMF